MDLLQVWKRTVTADSNLAGVASHMKEAKVPFVTSQRELALALLLPEASRTRAPCGLFSLLQRLLTGLKHELLLENTNNPNVNAAVEIMGPLENFLQTHPV